MSVNSHKNCQFGDYQTPTELVKKSIQWIRKRFPDFHPHTIVEPTCGAGNFLCGAGVCFPSAKKLVGIEVNEKYFETLQCKLLENFLSEKTTLLNQSFFDVERNDVLKDCESPMLIIGNPPWVTNSSIGRVKGTNLPDKKNLDKFDGLSALTGKSNFDISEPILTECFEWMRENNGIVSVLCKTSVARKVLRKLWLNQHRIESYMVRLSAKEYFDVSVEACLLVVRYGDGELSSLCHIFDDFEVLEPSNKFGYSDGVLVSNLSSFAKVNKLRGRDKHYQWRTGVKHDCRKVMELRARDDRFVNGMDEIVDIEDRFVFPLLKSSDVKNQTTNLSRYRVVITQRKIGDSTSLIAQEAPKTWNYLLRHGKMLDSRGSAVYKSNPRFSIFGIGEYSFREWKVAISGFYKCLNFVKIGPIDGKPVMLDDTVNFIGVQNEDEADFLVEILNSKQAKSFLDSLIFWENKRPITIDILRLLDIGRLAMELDRYTDYLQCTEHINGELQFEFDRSI